MKKRWWHRFIDLIFSMVSCPEVWPCWFFFLKNLNNRRIKDSMLQRSTFSVPFIPKKTFFLEVQSVSAAYRKIFWGPFFSPDGCVSFAWARCSIWANMQCDILFWGRLLRDKCGRKYWKTSPVTKRAEHRTVVDTVCNEYTPVIPNKVYNLMNIISQNQNQEI